jgi:2-polyprenyl-3-methyl-5-hydroxy-6-metoxy-1,4-benzoquinol methylase
MREVTSCPICKSTKLKAILHCDDYTVSHETFQIIKCQNCGLVITNPQPNAEILGNYYLSDNYISHSNQAKSILDKLYILVRKFTLTQKLKLVLQYSSKALLLDYGCGTGEFISTCKSNGWRTIGVEPSINARQKALSTDENIYESLEHVPDKKIDVITLWHVLEHVPDINGLLQQLYKMLTKNGTIFIAVPNYESYDADVYKEFWAAYDVPRHLWHFSKSSLEKLLANNSLKIKSIVPMKLDSFYVSLLSEKYRHGNVHSIKGIFSAFSTGVKSNLKAKKTNNYSSLIYVVQK